MTTAATSEIQVIAYHQNGEDGGMQHFHPVAPKVGPVAFVSDDGICQEGWVDGIITAVHVLADTPEPRWAITVHSTHVNTKFVVIVRWED